MVHVLAVKAHLGELGRLHLAKSTMANDSLVKFFQVSGVFPHVQRGGVRQRQTINPLVEEASLKIPALSHLDKGRLGDLGNAAGNLSLSAASGANHENVLGHNLPVTRLETREGDAGKLVVSEIVAEYGAGIPHLCLEIVRKLLSPPTIPHGHRHRTLRRSLSYYVPTGKVVCEN